MNNAIDYLLKPLNSSPKWFLWFSVPESDEQAPSVVTHGSLLIRIPEIVSLSVDVI